MEAIRHGAVAAGDRRTAEAAMTILEAGGSAFDATIAGLCAACVAEPVLASPGGGGFLMAAPAGRDPILYDFFAQTPHLRPAETDCGTSPTTPLDFQPIMADFGDSTQEFHIGTAAIAVPGMMPGLAAIHDDLCRLPRSVLVEPALALIRDGCPVAPLQAFILGVVAPIMMHTPDARHSFASPSHPDRPLQTGETARVAGLADTLALFAAEGDRPFRNGDPAQDLLALCRDHGGLLRPNDLTGFVVERRAPLTRALTSGNAEGAAGCVHLNPAPSSGGALIAFGLALRDGLETDGDAMTEPLLRAQIMAATADARTLSGLTTGCCSDRIDRLLAEPHIAETIAALTAGRWAQKIGGTTHLSVVDADGNAAAATVSNGEGCGHMLPRWGYMPNNMLGEEDINPQGFFQWEPDSRISSMMAPTIAETTDGDLLVLGSGGSNRIRSAVLQVLVDAALDGRPLADAVTAPRLHVEGETVHVEPGLPAPAMAALTAAYGDQVKAWSRQSMYFGGVHALRLKKTRTGTGYAVDAVGDPRRGGIGLLK